MAFAFNTLWKTLNVNMTLLISGQEAPPLDKDIGLLLDQEKAYNRVNLTFFKLVLNHYGFPEITIHCIYNSLMALNTIKININGYFTEAIPKLRGFKQDDLLLSCICHDLAFEPFLQGIHSDTDFSGYTFHRHPSIVSTVSVVAQLLESKCWHMPMMV